MLFVVCTTCCGLFVQVLSGEVKRFDLCLASVDLAEKVKPLQRKLRKLMPTPRRGQPFTEHHSLSACSLRRQCTLSHQSALHVSIGVVQELGYDWSR